MVPEEFRGRRNPWASAGVSRRRQALYRRVGEFGAGVGGGAVVQAAGSYRVQKAEGIGHVEGGDQSPLFCIVRRRGRNKKGGGVSSEIELKILSQIQKVGHGATKQQVMLLVLHAQPVLGALHVEAKLRAQPQGFRQNWVQIPILLLSHVTSEMLLIFCKPPFSV